MTHVAFSHHCNICHTLPAGSGTSPLSSNPYRTYTTSDIYHSLYPGAFRTALLPDKPSQLTTTAAPACRAPYYAARAHSLHLCMALHQARDSTFCAAPPAARVPACLILPALRLYMPSACLQDWGVRRDRSGCAVSVAVATPPGVRLFDSRFHSHARTAYRCYSCRVWTRARRHTIDYRTICAPR